MSPSDSSQRNITQSGCMFDLRPARHDNDAALAEMRWTKTSYPGDATLMLVQRTLGSA